LSVTHDPELLAHAHRFAGSNVPEGTGSVGFEMLYGAQGERLGETRDLGHGYTCPAGRNGTCTSATVSPNILRTVADAVAHSYPSP